MVGANRRCLGERVTGETGLGLSVACVRDGEVWGAEMGWGGVWRWCWDGERSGGLRNGVRRHTRDAVLAWRRLPIREGLGRVFDS